MINPQFVFILLLLFISCNSVDEKINKYEEQVGNTHFNPKTDKEEFVLCNPENTLHKRAFVKYDGGMQAIENDIIDGFVYNPKYENYNGFFVVRFIVNCQDKSGRFRMDAFDEEYNPTQPPSDLRDHILTIVKDLKKWHHPLYDDIDYDGYKFLVIKMVNGKIDYT